MKKGKIAILGAGLFMAGTMNANAEDLFSVTDMGADKVEMAELCCGYGNTVELRKAQEEWQREQEILAEAERIKAKREAEALARERSAAERRAAAARRSQKSERVIVVRL